MNKYFWFYIRKFQNSRPDPGLQNILKTWNTKDLKDLKMYIKSVYLSPNCIKMIKMSILLYQMRSVVSIILYVGFLFGSLTWKMELTWNSEDLKDLNFLSYQFLSKYNSFFLFFGINLSFMSINETYWHHLFQMEMSESWLKHFLKWPEILIWPEILKTWKQ